MKNNNSDSDFKDLQFVDLRLQNGQVELILRSMELYGYNNRRKKLLQLKQNKSIIKQIFLIPIQRWLKIC